MTVIIGSLQHTSTLISHTGPLSVDTHLKAVRQTTWDVRAQWYDLGVELGVNVGTLKVSALPRSSCVTTSVNKTVEKSFAKCD